jgi:hypothetical protein
MAEFRRPPFDARADQGQDADKFRVQIALHHLRGHGRGAQAQFRAQTKDSSTRRKMRAGADRPGKFADRHALAAVCSRSKARVNSSCISAIFNPKVVGSAWMPWLRPIIGVN